MYEALINVAVESWLVLGQMSPYLLLGFVVAGILSVCVSPERVERHLGGRGLGPVLKASLFGVPLPLCSCGVLPVSASLRRHGASKAATTAFLLSTPQTGVDSIAVTYALLGPLFAVFRPLAALLTGLLGGVLVRALGENAAASEEPPPTCSEPCCSDEKPTSALVHILRYGLLTLPRDIGVALLVGVVIAGALAALVPQDQLSSYVGGGILSILLLMAAGVPVYVCATASVPIAAGFMHMGASPGAALAFLIAGPATNMAALATIWKLLGRRCAVLYLLTVVVSAVACGLALDWLIPAMQTVWPQGAEHAHIAEAGGWLYNGSAFVLLAVLGVSYWTGRGHGHAHDQAAEPSPDAHEHEHVELLVTGMKCSHCADAIRRALREIAGVQSAEVDAADGQVTVHGENLIQAQLEEAVTALGYTVTQAGR